MEHQIPDHEKGDQKHGNQLDDFLHGVEIPPRFFGGFLELRVFLFPRL
jgi:hypothetical protein